MKAFQTIVVGIDFSEASSSALDEALRLAAPTSARVIAAEVVEKDVLEDQIRFHKIAPEQAMEKIHSNLTHFLAVHGALASVEPRVLVGSPYQCLADVVNNVEADLLVLGSRGWDHSPGTVGTIATRCIRRAALPVLLVRHSQHEGFKRIVACTDFSPAAALAVHRAAHFAVMERASLDLVHVDYPVWLQPVHVQYDLINIPDAEYQAQYRAAIKDKLAAHLATIAPDAPVEWVVHVLESASTSEAICQFVNRIGADLVVLGTSGRSGLNSLLLGTTAERLIQRSNCSVLAVRSPSVD